MKKVLYTALLISFFMGTTVLTSLAASEHEAHHPAGAQTGAPASSDKMMMPQTAGMSQMPCMAASASGSVAPMMGMMGGEGMHSMMHGGQMGMHAEAVGKETMTFSSVSVISNALRLRNFTI